MQSQIIQQKVMSNKKGLCESFSISESFFDEHFRDDPRMKSVEYRKGTKLLLWKTDKAYQYMQDILEELCE